MWKDDDDKIMDILDNIETQNRECFPVVCPICGEKDGHLYFHRNREGNERGSMWVWCSTCHHFAHVLYRLPKWWKNLEEINFENLTSYPNYLEENKFCIDEWVNKLIFYKYIIYNGTYQEDKRKIKDIYNRTSITSSEELYPLQKWYNQLIEKKIGEITVADVLKMIRQKEFMNLAMSKAINFLQEDVFVGELYEGELFEKISEMDGSFLIFYADDLKNIIKNALVKSEIHNWSYDGEKEEFKDLIDSLSKKVM